MFPALAQSPGDHAFAEIGVSETATGVLAQRSAYLLSPTTYDGTLEAPATTGGAGSELDWRAVQSYAGATASPAL